MVPIYIDTQTLMEDLVLSEQEARGMMNYVVKSITASYARTWEQEAARNLGAAREEYIKSIVTIDTGQGSGAVILTGWLPNAIEDGWPSFDMKPGLLSGPNAKINEKGIRTNVVPYRWATPGAIGESPVFTGKLPEEIHSLVKEKPFVIPVTGGGYKTEPLKIEEIPKHLATPIVKKVSSLGSEPQNWITYKNKNSLYEGISKVADSKTGQNRYVSFRKVSDNSDPAAFIHPGFSGEFFAEKSMDDMNIASETGIAIDHYLKNIGWI